MWVKTYRTILTKKAIVEREKESIDGLEVYISVPEDSYKTNAHGEKMCGMFLAKRFKQVLVEMGVKRLTVRARVRAGTSGLLKRRSKQTSKQDKKCLVASGKKEKHNVKVLLWR